MKNNRLFESIGMLNKRYFRIGKKQMGRLGTNILCYAMLICLSALFIAPFFYMVSFSLMSTVDLANINIKWLPRHVVADNYVYAVKALDYLRRLGWSLLIALLSVVGQTFSCSFVGYGLARIKFKFRELAFALIIFALLVPPQTIIMTQYLMFADAGYFAIIAPSFFSLGVNGGLFVFLFRQFFKGMPSELENAALIDGTGVFGAYFRIMLPNSKSVMVVTVILSFIWQWNNYFEPTIFIKEIESYTLSMMLSNLWVNAQSMFSTVGFNHGINMAATVLCVLPLVVIFLFLQKLFIQGVESTGLAN